MSNAFMPVKGSDAMIKKFTYNDGYVYFATDSGKIYLDSNGQNKIAMGGSGASVLYTTQPDATKRPDGNYILVLSKIPDSVNVKQEDLIINEGDKCFYKVKIIDWSNDQVICSRIAVSGSGGSTGPGGGTGGSASSAIRIDSVTGVASRMTFIHGSPAIIKVVATSDKDAQVELTFEIIRADYSVTSFKDYVNSGEEYPFDLGSRLSEGVNSLTIYAHGSLAGDAYPVEYNTLEAVKVGMIPIEFNPTKVMTTNERVLNVSLTGAGLTKRVEAFIDNTPFFKKENAGNIVQIILPGSKLPVPEGGPDPNEGTFRQEHGVHELKICLTPIVNGKEISNTVPDLIYEFAWAEEDKTTPLIWFNNLPTSITNYTIAPIYFQVYDPMVASEIDFTVNVLKDGVTLPESPKTVQYIDRKWNLWNISNYSLGNNEFTINRNGTSRSFSFYVEEDLDRKMEIAEGSLLLSLDSQGRSSTEASYNREKWSYTNSLNNTISASFNNFNWVNNGWVDDERNVSALRISNGANLSIPLNLLNTTALDESLTFEFQFKISNITNYITMVSSGSQSNNNIAQIDNEEDEPDYNVPEEAPEDTSSVRPDWDTIAFANFYRNQVGFAFGPSDFFMHGGGTLAHARYKENELINVSIVINKTEKLIYLYINGILSRVKKCDPDSNFRNQTSSLVFNPTSCDIDLYKVRVYTRALSSTEVVQNMLADLKNVVLYDVNQITETDIYGNDTISYSKLLSYNIKNPDNPSMPYAVLKINDTVNSQLPFYKGNKVSCDITFVNPALDRAYETGELALKANAAGISVEEYYLRHCPSFHKSQAEVDVQGTSSQGYPRRNYKLKCNPKKYGGAWVANRGPFAGVDKDGKEKKVSLDGMYLDNARSEATFTWKADYMESSGTHNTGFTSYVKTIYSKHPLADYYGVESIENYNDLRTTIYGFPMLVFEEKADGSYQFIGKYNFNLDKDCPNVTGMSYDKQHPVLKDKKMKEVCECWEMCNNKGTRTSFKLINYDEIKGWNEKDQKMDYSLVVPDDIEYRYLDKGKNLEQLLENPSEINNIEALKHYRNIQDLAEWIYSTDTSAATNEAIEPVIYGTKEYTVDNAEYRLAKFEAEFAKHIDMEYATVYFIMTEVLVLFDSRAKNMMLATWGPQEEGGNYIWYPIFYDCDTQLGLDNSGVPLCDYDVDATADSIFSSPRSVLWNNFYEVFYTHIKNTYAKLRKGGANATFSFNKLNGYYDYNPDISGSYAMRGARPYVAYNADEFYKYIAPARENYGYVNTDGETQFTDTYYYCAQGTRELQRELFLNNRFYYMDSIWGAGDFEYGQNSGQVQVRINANNADQTSDQHWGIQSPEYDYRINYPDEFDTLDYFTITPFLNSRVGLLVDESQSMSDVVVPAGTSYDLKVPADKSKVIQQDPFSDNGQLVYLGGKKYVSSYGDLSRYYSNEIDLNGANKLTDIILGSDLDEYKNLYFGNEGRFVFDETNGYPLLKEVNVSRLSECTLDFNFLHSEKLENFRALYSKITGVQFAPGVQLQNCYLPRSIQYLRLTKASNLKNILTSEPYKNFDTNIWPTGLYVEGLTDKLVKIKNRTASPSELATNIHTIAFDTDSMGTASYELLEGIIGIKELIKDSDQYNAALSINMLNVDWSPYQQVEIGAANDPNVQYYEKTEQYTFIEYTYNANTWSKDVLNGKIYQLKRIQQGEQIINMNPDNSPISDLRILDILIDDYVNHGAQTFFGPGKEGTIGYITGNIYINNTADNPLAEVDIQNKYLKYYPGLTITAKYTSPALTVNYLEENSDGKLTQWGPQKYSIATGDLNKPIVKLPVTPDKTHYDFLGWSLTYGKTTPDDKQPVDYTVDELKAIAGDSLSVTFWAVYTIHKYKIEFYNDDKSILWDGKTLDADGQPVTLTKYVEAQQFLFEPEEILPYKDSSKLGEYQAYDFKGYSFSSGNVGPGIDLTTIKATKDLVFYAYYGNPVDDIRTVIHPEYFTISNVNYTYGDSLVWGDPEQWRETGLVIGLKKKIQGKITIPSKINGVKVVALDSSFSGSNEYVENYVSTSHGDGLTHIFFQSDSSVREFFRYAFYKNKNLIRIELPKSLRRIGDRSFQGCTSLKLKNNYLGDNIAYIGEGAFIQAFDNKNVIDITLGSNIKVMQNLAFANLNAPIANLYLGSEQEPFQLDMSMASANATPFSSGASQSRIENIYVYGDYVEDEILSWFLQTAYVGTIQITPPRGEI